MEEEVLNHMVKSSTNGYFSTVGITVVSLCEFVGFQWVIHTEVLVTISDRNPATYFIHKLCRILPHPFFTRVSKCLSAIESNMRLGTLHQKDDHS